MKKTFLNILICILFTLLVTEFFCRIFIQSPEILDSTSALSSTRWRLLWLKDHSVGPITGYNIDVYHPTFGWYPQKNISNVSFGKGFVSFNSQGIRGKKEYTQEKLKDTTRIVVVGDSFSFGEDLNDDQTYPAQLEKLLPNSEVLNMAVHGYGIDQMSLRLDQEGLLYHPDIVVYAFISDDLNRAIPNFRSYMKPQYIVKNDDIVLSNVPVTPPAELIRTSKLRPATLDFLLLLLDRFKYRNNQSSSISPLAISIWKHTVESIRTKQAIPVFLYLPSGEAMIYKNSVKIEEEQLMFKFCRSEGITCFSARPYLESAYAQGAKYNLKSHYEPATAKIVATGLAKDLQKAFPSLFDIHQRNGK